MPVPGTYKTVDPSPQGLRAVLIAPIAGFYNPDTNQAAAIDVALFVLIIGGFLGVVTKTGAIDAGIGGAMSALKGREKWMIPILMALFAAGGTIYGMAEESLAFYALIIPVMIAAGYDALTAVAIIMLGRRRRHARLDHQSLRHRHRVERRRRAVHERDAVAVRRSWASAGSLRVAYVMRYAERVRKDPSQVARGGPGQEQPRALPEVAERIGHAHR